MLHVAGLIIGAMGFLSTTINRRLTSNISMTDSPRECPISFTANNTNASIYNKSFYGLDASQSATILYLDYAHL